MKVFFTILVLGLWVAYSWSMGQIPDSGLNGFGKLVAGSFFIAAPLLYFYPTFEAARRQQPNATSIGLINVFLGWTLIGWVVAISWACKTKASQVPAARSSVMPQAAARIASARVAASGIADEISKLADLRDRGILTAEQFEQQKMKLLG